MKVVFRVDASIRMGIGHMMRCLTLAEALRGRGVQIRFVCREHNGNLIALLQQRAMPVTVLPTPVVNDAATDEDYTAWLGVTQAEDAEQTIEALNSERPDWLVVDHYGLNIEWEQLLRPQVRKLMVIDDLANRHHDCDLLLDQNYSAKGELRYVGLVPTSCELLMGPRYALLRPEYAAYRKTLRARDGQVKSVLVFFGGSDPQNMTGLALEALSHAELSYLNVDVVIGANNPHRKTLEKQSAQRSHTTIHGPRPHLADLMAGADLAIGAGGATTWERMCLGLPTIVISIAKNQLPASEALAQASFIYYEGHHTEINTDNLTQLIKKLSHGGEGLARLSTSNQLQVDGLGALRLAEVLCPSDVTEIRLRPANDEDIMNSQLFVLEVAGLPVGQIRFDKEEEEARIDYSLDAVVQGRGWDARLVTLGVDYFQQIEAVRLRAEVEAPRPVFMRMKRKDVVNISDGGTEFSLAILSDRASWLNDYIQALFLDWLAAGHRVLWVHDKQELRPGDFCFYLSCGQIVQANILSQFRHNLVVHESDLPKGRGWSPLTWQILEGKNRIPATLLEATGKVDSGVIYAQEWMVFQGHELVDELRGAQANATLKLCKRFVENYPQILDETREQIGEESFYLRRREMDSQLDIALTLKDQFNLLRVADNKRYPSFFYKNGQRYFLRVEKEKNPLVDQGKST